MVGSTVTSQQEGPGFKSPPDQCCLWFVVPVVQVVYLSLSKEGICELVTTGVDVNGCVSLYVGLR